MKNRSVAVVTVLFILAAAATVRSQHPIRIFVTPEKIEAIKKAITVKGSTHAEAYECLRTYVDGKGRQCYDPANKNWSYDRSYMGSCAAFMYQLTGDKKYAELSYQVLRDIYDKQAPDPRLPDTPRLYGLAKARIGLGFGMAYQLCHDAWSVEQRGWIASIIGKTLDGWPKYGHAQLQVDRGSNWVAVCRGGELMLILLADQAAPRADRVKKLVRDLKRHMQIVYGPEGYSQEGIGYTAYGGSFLLPVCLALRDHGDDTLMKELGRHAFWRGMMFHGTSRMEDSSKQRVHLMQGVGGWSIYDEGFCSAALGTVPADKMPYFLWFYDRHMGKLAPGRPAEKYDNDHAGMLWALIYYPTGITPVDPIQDKSMGRSIGDKTCGVFLFRNRWQDSDDIQTLICSDLQNHRAWDAKEATQIGLHAHGTMFFGGPCKGLGRGVDNHHTFSRVLIDGKAHIGRGTGKNGKTIAYEPDADGGYVVAGGGSTYQSMGVDLARHYLVDFSPGPDSAILSTLDRMKSPETHTYTWNGNLGTESQDDGVKVSGSKEGGRSTFLLQGHNGWVKGWVMHPADATLKADKDPLQITTEGAEADIWVVMLVGKGKAPAGKITGAGLGARLSVAGKTVRYHPQTDRVLCE